jgi:hypothetical protein
VAQQCFCGCGRKVGFTDRRLNKLGQLYDVHLAGLEELVIKPMSVRHDDATDDQWAEISRATDNVRSLVADGNTLRDTLIRVAHHEASIREFDQAWSRRWMHTAGQMLDKVT